VIAPHGHPAPPTPLPIPPTTGLALCVLASGSAGNCAALVFRPAPGAPRRIVLLDAGLSPNRTAKLLLQRGIRPHEVDDIVFTHLDSDHCHPGWPNAIRPGGWRARLRIHRRHLGRAERAGLLCRHTEPFESELTIDPHLHASVCTSEHDSLGVAAFRFVAHCEHGQTHLGYATDLGAVTNTLTRLMQGVDLLAIESNYCPVLQHASDRPEFLKRRIMGGAGHLSNAESADAARVIDPRQHLVLLHLSRQCNTPERALAAHAQHRPAEAGGRRTTITDQHRPTTWIPITPGPQRAATKPVAQAVAQPAFARPAFPRSLFDLPARNGDAW
jgi:phosphoribosyl 1,2-cyclic phosphodiesterase